jgi:hypothetical protein
MELPKFGGDSANNNINITESDKSRMIAAETTTNKTDADAVSKSAETKDVVTEPKAIAEEVSAIKLTNEQKLAKIVTILKPKMDSQQLLHAIRDIRTVLDD